MTDENVARTSNERLKVIRNTLDEMRRLGSRGGLPQSEACFLLEEIERLRATLEFQTNETARACQEYRELLHKQTQELRHIDETPTTIKCRFGCDDPAVVLVEFQEGGCVCHADIIQALCAQHWQCSEPVKGARVIAELCSSSETPTPIDSKRIWVWPDPYYGLRASIERPLEAETQRAYDRGFAVGSGDEGAYQREIGRLKQENGQLRAALRNVPCEHWSGPIASEDDGTAGFCVDGQHCTCDFGPLIRGDV